jgi:uncharacterized protein YndB with AHSA1/START domain
VAIAIANKLQSRPKSQEDGETSSTATGEYLEIERPHRLKYTYTMPQFYPNIDTISIEITSEEAGYIVMFVQAGWQQGFDLMAAAWESPPNNSFKPTTSLCRLMSDSLHTMLWQRDRVALTRTK